VIASVQPLFVPDTEGGVVTITGTNLGNGDITEVRSSLASVFTAGYLPSFAPLQVLLCGTAVSSIQSQTSTQVIVMAAPRPTAATRFDAQLTSTTMGPAASAAGAFYYSLSGTTRSTCAFSPLFWIWFLY
jgi:hypothetical protein